MPGFARPVPRLPVLPVSSPKYQIDTLELWNFGIDTLGITFLHIINVHIAVLQLVLRAQKEIAEEHLQELCGGVNLLLRNGQGN